MVRDKYMWQQEIYNVLGIGSFVVQKRFSGINFAKTQAVEMSNLTCRIAQLNVCNCLISRADLPNLTSRANRDEQRFGVGPNGVLRPFQAVFSSSDKLIMSVLGLVPLGRMNKGLWQNDTCDKSQKESKRFLLYISIIT